MSIDSDYSESHLDSDLTSYTDTLRVGMKVVVGRGACDCGASSMPHPKVCVTTVRAIGMGVIITPVAPYFVSNGQEVGFEGVGEFNGILDPSMSLDAQYALCEEELNDMTLLKDTVDDSYVAKEYIELECLRLEAKLDDLMVLVTDRF